MGTIEQLEDAVKALLAPIETRGSRPDYGAKLTMLVNSLTALVAVARAAETFQASTKKNLCIDGDMWSSCHINLKDWAALEDALANLVGKTRVVRERDALFDAAENLLRNLTPVQTYEQQQKAADALEAELDKIRKAT